MKDGSTEAGRSPVARMLSALMGLWVVLALGCGLGEAASRDPAETVHGFYDVLLSTMQSGPSLGEKGRYDRLAPAIGSSFDIAYMAQKAVGTGWAKLAPAQQEAVTEAFRRYMIATYADRFDSYSGEKFQVGSTAPTSFGTIVESRIVKSDGAPVSINYLMRENGNGWQIADVYLTGTISQLATLRSQFSSVLARQGVDGLIAMLNQKAETMVANSKS